MSESTTISDANETAMREFNAAIFDDHDLDAVEEYLAPDFVHYTAGVKTASGLSEAREYFEGILSAFPDIDMEILELVADDELVMQHFTATGTHEGDLPIARGDGEMDVIPATGKTASWEGFVSARFEDGKLVEAHLVSDQFGMAKQLGLIPADN